MSQKPALKSRYTAVFQGLFDGIEWTVYKDSNPIRVGTSDNLGNALRDARRAYREYLRRPDPRLSHVFYPRDRRLMVAGDFVMKMED